MDGESDEDERQIQQLIDWKQAHVLQPPMAKLKLMAVLLVQLVRGQESRYQRQAMRGFPSEPHQ